MSLFDECCVLIPTATLEDFPSDLSDYAARSLLAAWTVLWDPRLLAQTEQLPAWYRADSPPDPIGRRLIACPASSRDQLPEHYEMRARESAECSWVSGESREEMLGPEMIGGLGLGEIPDPLACEDRVVSVADFYAAGYASLQIQVMTRRLRYTSNLDEIHLQNRVVAAAKSFLERDETTTAEALHDVFDCLAEERDHYFSSDPHLIELTLTSKSTVGKLLDAFDSTDSELASSEGAEDSAGSKGASSDESPATSEKKSTGENSSVLAIPSNLLVDIDVAEELACSKDDRSDELRRRMVSGNIGWAGGGPPKDTTLDVMTLSQAESVFERSHERTTRAIGAPPPVYGRFSGATPADMTPFLVKLGYCGMVPIDFENGTGHGDEAKVIMQSAGAELESLTAKPIDASSDAAFLTLGTRLGEAIDSGEIATALLAHWPGQTCDSFEDLRRVATWSLSLGKFWKLDDYFLNGEHPYHHGSARATSPDAAKTLEPSGDNPIANPISSLAAEFRQQVTKEETAVLQGMADLVTGESSEESDPAFGFASAVTGSPQTSAPESDAGDGHADDAVLLINPHSVGCRESVTVTGAVSAAAKHVFAASAAPGRTNVTVDVPACGFVLVRGGEATSGSGIPLGKRLREKMFGGPRSIAEQWSLRNEFMEVTISAETGAISGVYSGGIRGNRFSMRLVSCGHDQQVNIKTESETTMRCNKARVVSSTAASGCIETQGEIISEDGSTLADYSIRYSLDRGSRMVKVEGELSPRQALHGNPWQNYLAARVAVVTESAVYRLMLRDKLHRARSRRLIAPLGVVIDEAERHTMIAGCGLAFHRCVGDRFLDTLLTVPGEKSNAFKSYYGFDVPVPVAMARSAIVSPSQVAIESKSDATEIGWVIHTAPKDILVTGLKVSRRNDGRLAAIIRVIQTRSQSCKASIRFLHDVHRAASLAGGSPDQGLDSWINVDLSDSEDSSSEDAKSEASVSTESSPSSRQHDEPIWLQHAGDVVHLSLPSHGIADVLVVFDEGAASS